MEQTTQTHREIPSFLGKKRFNLSSLNNPIYRPLIVSDLKSEYEHTSFLIKQIFSFDWNDKFLKDNQQILNNLTPTVLWFIICSLYFPIDLPEILKNAPSSLFDIISFLTSESENFSLKKTSSIKNRQNIIDEIMSLAKNNTPQYDNENIKSLSKIEGKVNAFLKQIKEKNILKICNLIEKKAKFSNINNNNTNSIGKLQRSSLMRDISLSNDNMNTMNKYIDYLQEKARKKSLFHLSTDKKIFDIGTELKQIKDEDDWVCFICNNGDVDDNQLIYECESCSITVHQNCYGIKTDKVEHWKCDACKLMSKEQSQKLQCVLCPVKGGAMKKADLPIDCYYVNLLQKIRNDDNFELPKYNSCIDVPIENFDSIECCWVHMSCALWNPEIVIENFEEKKGIKYIDLIEIKKFKEKCDVCMKKGYGCVFKCNYNACNFEAHPECARINGYYMEVVNNQGTLNYNIYCNKHKPVKLVKNIKRKITEKEEDVRDFTKFIKKVYKSYEREYNKSLTEIKVNKTQNEMRLFDEREMFSTLINSNSNTYSSYSNESSISKTKSSTEKEINTPLSERQNEFISQFKHLLKKMYNSSFITLIKSNIDGTYHLEESNNRYLNKLTYQLTLSCDFPWRLLKFEGMKEKDLKAYYIKLIPSEYAFNNRILNDVVYSNVNYQEIGNLQRYDDKVYCYCKKKDESDTMICCENANKCIGSFEGWYHLECVKEFKGMSREEIEKAKFICDICQRAGKKV